jgi:HPt (histidine-containing phosphotransfer) domain-containing protein
MADAPVDLSHLARYTGGDRDLNTEILRLFNGQLHGMVGELLTVLEQRDARKWREVTHTIKGAARGVGAFAMGDAAAAAEPVDPATSPDRAVQLIEALRVEGEAVQAFIEEYVAAA